MTRLALSASKYHELTRRVFERDGWKCRACNFRQTLHAHHIQFRSQQGPDTSWNLITLCSECHDNLHVKRTLVIVGDNADVPGQIKFIRITPNV